PRDEPKVPHAVRAYKRYQEASGVEPFFTRVRAAGGANLVSNTGRPVFPATAPHLALHAVMSAIRNHYMGSDFGDRKCPEGVNPIQFFVQENEKDHQFADFPKARFAPGYVFLSEANLVHILFSSDETKGIIQRVTGDATAQAAEERVVRIRGWLIQQLFYNTASGKRFDGYHRKVRLQSAPDGGEKFRLRGTICTNGLVLNLLAYDTTAPRRRRQGPSLTETEEASSSSAPQQPSPGGDDTEDEAEDSDLFNVENQIEGDFVLDDAFITEEGELPQGSPQGSSPSSSDDEDDSGTLAMLPMTVGEAQDRRRHGQAHPLQPFQAHRHRHLQKRGPRLHWAKGEPKQPSSPPSDDIKWLHSSKILKNVGLLYTNPGNSPDPDRTTVIGMDPKVFRFDQANPWIPSTLTEEDLRGENNAASGTLIPQMKPKPKPKLKPKTAAQKKNEEERAKKAQKKEEETRKEEKKKKTIKHVAPSTAPSAKAATREVKATSAHSRTGQGQQLAPWTASRALPSQAGSTSSTTSAACSAASGTAVPPAPHGPGARGGRVRGKGRGHAQKRGA
ncbi:hypothetical protein BGZ72_001341, partial [Mortierella alpina]